MGHYRSNVRDLEFTLFEVLGRGQVLGHGPYGDVDEETAREMLRQVAVLAEKDLAESLLESDRTPPVYDPVAHTVTIPEAFKRSYRAWTDSGFWNVDVPAELDGTVVPPSFKWAMWEMVLGANPAVGMYAATYSFAKLLHLLGTDEQKTLARLMIENHWAPRWCSPSPTPAPTSARAARRRSSCPTARGASPASSASSPAPSTT